MGMIASASSARMIFCIFVFNCSSLSKSGFERSTTHGSWVSIFDIESSRSCALDAGRFCFSNNCDCSNDACYSTCANGIGIGIVETWIFIGTASSCGARFREDKFEKAFVCLKRVRKQCMFIFSCFLPRVWQILCEIVMKNCRTFSSNSKKWWEFTVVDILFELAETNRKFSEISNWKLTKCMKIIYS